MGDTTLDANVLGGLIRAPAPTKAAPNGVKLGCEPKLTADQKREAIKRRHAGAALQGKGAPTAGRALLRIGRMQ
jgi:hypothetical protein